MIELTPDQQAFVDYQVEIGAFGGPAEVVQAGLELLREAAERRERSETVAEIREALEQLERGEGMSVEAAFESVRTSMGMTASRPSS